MQERNLDYFLQDKTQYNCSKNAFDLSNGIPRPEYPRPQMSRQGEWMNLNGEWDFSFDFSASGLIQNRLNDKLSGKGFDHKIIVPFCPESKLSGIGYTDFIPAVWYQKDFTLNQDQCAKRILLHFGAVDYSAYLYINAQKVSEHHGGYTPFSTDITEYIKQGSNIITLYVQDDVRSGKQPCGKQAYRFHAENYSRVTGIWQTVWIEFLSECYIKNYQLIADPDNNSISLRMHFNKPLPSLSLKAQAYYEGEFMGERLVKTSQSQLCFNLSLSEVHLWEPGHARLYDLSFTLFDQERIYDALESYFGLRTITLGKNVVNINGKPVFQRLVLDQGYHSDGIYTAKDDRVYENDIACAMVLGFTGARMHQKIFDPRYIYHADQAGFLLWGEHASWGLDISDYSGVKHFLPEWQEMLVRDCNSPAIIAWCPFNETVDELFDTGCGCVFKSNQDDDVLKTVYSVTKMFDPTRPVIDTSGYFHVVTDIFDVHDYDQNPESLQKRYQ